MQTIRTLFIFIFIVISYNNDARSVKNLEPKATIQSDIVQIHTSVHKMWHNFIKSYPEFKNEQLLESDFYHNHNHKEEAIGLPT